MSDTDTDQRPVLVDLEEDPGALTEGWKLFLIDVRRLAAESRRRHFHNQQKRPAAPDRIGHENQQHGAVENA